MPQRLRKRKIYSIRAYCKSCDKLLNESYSYTLEELIEKWDTAVLEGPFALKCDYCKSKFPNYNVYYMIYNSKENVECTPDSLLPKKNVNSFVKMLRETATKESLKKD